MPKSETLTIRLDAKSRFILDFIAKARGQQLTTVLDRAITAAAEDVQVDGQAWRDVWSVSEGERALRMARLKDLYPTFEEERRLAFALEHWPFFYADADGSAFMTHYVDILWPRIDEFAQFHDDMRQRDYHAAGRSMQDALQEAGVEAPTWPPR